MKVALVSGKSQSTFTALISGAIDLSAFVPALFQLAYDSGISRQVSLYIYIGCFSIHIINTLFISPKFKILNTDVMLIDDSLPTPGIESSNPSAETTEKKGDCRSFIKYAFSPLYIAHIFWFTVVQLRFWFILGTFNNWLEELTNDNIRGVSNLTMVFEYLHFLVVIVAPIIGLTTDWQVNKAANEKQERCVLLGVEEKDTPLTRARPLIGILMMATVSCIALSVAALFWTSAAAIAMSIFTVVLKVTMYAAHLVFSQTVYPPEHHGKAFGIVLTVACLVDLVEIPMFTWAISSDPPYLATHILLLVLSVLILLHPLLIWIRNISKTRIKEDVTLTCYTQNQ